MTANLPEPLPRCHTHGTAMALIPPSRQAALTRWCGVWYECNHPWPHCGNTFLFHSKELLAQLDEQRARVDAAKETVSR